MENASNALIIVATILIALIVLSIGVYLAVKISKVPESYDQTAKTEELTKFNSRFAVFQNRSDISAQEIVTLNNYINAYNSGNDPPIDLIIEGTAIAGVDSRHINDAITFISGNSTKNVGGHEQLITFTCGGVQYDSGKVSQITFTKNP